MRKSACAAYGDPVTIGATMHHMRTSHEGCVGPGPEGADATFPILTLVVILAATFGAGLMCGAAATLLLHHL